MSRLLLSVFLIEYVLDKCYSPFVLLLKLLVLYTSPFVCQDSKVGNVKILKSDMTNKFLYIWTHVTNISSSEDGIRNTFSVRVIHHRLVKAAVLGLINRNIFMNTASYTSLALLNLIENG